MLSADILYFIPSTRRPHNVENMMSYGIEWRWIVADRQDYRDYMAAGAEMVIIRERSGLAGARNTALGIAQATECLCLMCDDDMTGLYMTLGPDRDDMFPIGVADVAEQLRVAMMSIDTPLGAVLPVQNPYFSRQRIHTWAFCCARFMLVDPCLLYTSPSPRD